MAQAQEVSIHDAREIAAQFGKVVSADWGHSAAVVNCLVERKKGADLIVSVAYGDDGELEALAF